MSSVRSVRPVRTEEERTKEHLTAKPDKENVKEGIRVCGKKIGGNTRSDNARKRYPYIYYPSDRKIDAADLADEKALRETD